MSQILIDSEQFQMAIGYERLGDLEKCLKKNGVRVLYGKNGQPFTTLDAINAALGLKARGAREKIDIL